jgi:hypothetical protein
VSRQPNLRCDIVELRPLSPFIAQAAGKTVDAARAQTPTWASGRYGDLDAPRSIASGHTTRLPNTYHRAAFSIVLVGNQIAEHEFY